MNAFTMSGRRAVASAVAILLSVLLPGVAQAGRPKTDILVLKNGDRMRGEITALSRGRLSFDTDAAGVISVKWDRVAELTTTFLYEVETQTGERLLGTLSPAAAAGSLVVTSEAGARRTFAVQSIVGLEPIGRSFWSRLDGSIDLGGSYTQSSGVAQLYVNFWTTAHRPAFEWRLAFDDYLTLEGDGTTTEQLTGSYAYSRYVSRRWALFGLVQAERNPDLGFDFRGTLAGGVEWTLTRSNRNDIVVGAGLGASREKSVEGDTEVEIPALLSFRQSLFIYDAPKTTLETRFIAYPILNQWGRWRLRADATVKREIFKDFTVGFTFYESFDSRPPSAEASRNDVGATISLGYAF